MRITCSRTMNEYLQEFKELKKQNSFKGEQWFGKRRELVEEYSWAVPNKEVLDYISNFDVVVEVGAGNGYWGHLIKECGTFTNAVDIDPPDDTYMAVTERNASTLNLSESTVLMVWPPTSNAMASRVAQTEPNHILYVGESRGGCTATDAFFDILDEQYGRVKTIDIPSYEGIHDNFHHYIRKV